MYLYIRPLAAHKHSKQTHIFPVTNLMFTSPAPPPQLMQSLSPDQLSYTTISLYCAINVVY